MKKRCLLQTVIGFLIILVSFSASPVSAANNTPENVLYEGTIYHIFFHSLVVYPELAFDNSKAGKMYKKYMITKDEFQKILPELYKNNFILIDIASIYDVHGDGTVTQKSLYLPQGKKPLIISLDDLSYYHTMKGHGFANKLVLDSNGNVATEIVTPQGVTQITRDGDVVPIIDDFVAQHPDFSFQGAKGTIALTGYEGILGYRTNRVTSVGYAQTVADAKKVIEQLKSTGWRFASHSYSHNKEFSTDTISFEQVKEDTDRWDREVRPLVGDTDVFVGPFGQIFGKDDPRRNYLISKGFKMFCGVGMKPYIHYSVDSIVMDRADIDRYRLTHPSKYLKTYFNLQW